MKSAHKSSVATVKAADGANTRLPSLKPRDMDHCSAAPRRYTAPHARAGVGAIPARPAGNRARPRLRPFPPARGGAEDSRKPARAPTIRLARAPVAVAAVEPPRYPG